MSLKPSLTTPLRAVAAPLMALLALLAALLATALAPAAAHADGTPNISLAVDAQASVLYGQDSTVRFTTTNPGPYGYNLSYRAVLPNGVHYVPGSAGAEAGEPQVITNQPAANQTTLLWRNLSDLSPTTVHNLNFQVSHSTVAVIMGTVFTITGGAYIHDDPRYVPQFTALGQPDSGGANPYTGFSANKTDTTRVSGMEIEKTSTATPEGELLRGVHNHQSLHTLTVRNNDVAQTTQLYVDDYLPAGLEFLGCGGGADNTTDAPTNPGSAEEYPGAGPITVAAVAGCTVPQVVETVNVDPPGPAPAGIYTHVRWTGLGAVPAGGTLTLRYRAAIPMRANTTTWSSGLPALNGPQTTNLDNNSGPEIADEATLTNYARASGEYNDLVFMTADASLARTAEDLTIEKAAQTSTLAQGATNLWDLTVRTSEYRSAAAVVVTDTLPDGLCPVDATTNFTQPPQGASDLADCGPGTDPTIPYASVVENTDGTWTLTWDGSSDPALDEVGPSDVVSITFESRGRATYQEAFNDDTPLLARDRLTNSVAVAANARVLCTGGVPCPGGAPTGTELDHDGALSTPISDASSAAVTAAAPTLDKKVADTSTNCGAASYSDGSPAPAYRPGDRICWLLRVDYPAALDTQHQTITDFLPNTLTFDTAFGTAGDEFTASDTIPGATLDSTSAVPGPGGELTWTLPSSYVAQAQVFEHRIATRVGLPAGSALGDVVSNVLKSSTSNTAGATEPLRDSADYRLSLPVMSTNKRVMAVDGTPINGTTGVATQVVRGGQVITYRVRLTNSGDAAAEAVEAWDRLPAGLTCTDIANSLVAISDGGVCSGDVIRWGATPAVGPNVGALSSVDLTYAVLVPDTIEPTQVLTNTAGVREFQTTTNTGGTFVYIPASNIDPTQDGSANVSSPKGTATLTGAIPTITKTRTTLTTESNAGTDWNSTATATIGETVRYTVSATVPAGITVRDLDVTDAIDARHVYTGGTLAQTAGPVASSLGIAGSTITMSLGASYTAPTGADTTFSFTFDTTVADTTANYRTGPVLVNQASMFYTPPGTLSGGPRTQTDSIQATTQIVEPALLINKTADVGSTPVVGNQIVEYTVVVGAATGTASPAHETELVDVVPLDMTPLNAAGDPILDGESTLDGGVWNLAARTLTFSPSATLYPGQSNSFTYRVRVNDPATGGSSLTNTATARTSSLAGVVAGERATGSPRTVGYIESDANTLNVLTPSVTKSVANPTLTIGEKTVYTVDVTIPANTINYDTLVKDVLPDSIDFDGYASASCISGCAPGPTTPTIQTYTPVLSAGLVTVAWDLGDLVVQSATTRVVRLTYDAHLRATHRNGGAGVVRPQTSLNSVRVMANITDQVGAFDANTIPAGPFDDTSAAATATVTAVEPGVTLDKRIAVGAGAYGNGPSLVRDGDALHYQLTITNTGNSPAYDVAVTDVPNAEIEGITTAAGLSTTAVTDAWAAPGDDIKWVIPGPIAAGGTAVLQYDAALPTVTVIGDGDHFDNSAQVTAAFGLPDATRTADGFVYRTYTSAIDTTRATFDSPTIVVDKTTGAGAGPIYPDSAPAQVGQAFSWRVRVTNTSASETATNLTVVDTLPPNWTYVAASASFSPGGAAEPTIVPNAGGDELVWSTALTLAPGANRLLTFQARPTLASATTPGIGAGNPHTNSAMASVDNGVGNGADENGLFAGAANTATAILSVPSFTVAKTPNAGTAASGETVPFHIVVTNTGLVGATNVVVSDPFPAGLTYTPGSATAAPATGFSETAGTASAATWTIASLAAGASVDITVPLATDPAAPAATVLTNTASVLSDQTATPVTDNGAVTLTPSADVVASKSASPNPATAGQTLTYTLGATNNGPSVAADVVLTDTLPATVDFVSASAGCVWASGPRTVTCTYAGATAVGASRTATITTTVVPGTTTDADNTVVASSGTPDPSVPNNTATVLVPVGARADLSIDKTASAGTVLRDQLVSFALAYENAGPSVATAVEITDTLPAGLTYVSGPAGCAAVGQVVTCTLGALAVGDSGTRTIVARGTALGAQTNSATITSTTLEPPAGVVNETDTAVVTVVASADLSLTKSAPATVPAGGNLTYTLSATNAGPDDATGVVLSDTLPAGTTFLSGDAGCAAAGQTVTCAVGNLADGASASRQLTVRVAVAAGDSAITNNASVDGAQADPNPGNDAASASTQVGPAADVSITQSAPSESTAGGTMTVTLVARNNGPSTATGVIVTAQLPPGVTLADITTAQGTCTAVGSTITCNLGSLLNGTSTAMTITVNVPVSASGTSLTSLATVSSDQPDPNGGNAATGTTVQVIAPPVVDPPVEPPPPGDPGPPPPRADAPNADLGLEKVADGVARAGERLTYSITATNRGPSAAKEVVVTDALVGGVTFLSAKSAKATCSFSKGTIRCPFGTIDNGETVRITVAVRPDKAGTVVNNAFVSGATTDPNMGDNRAVATGTVPQQQETKLSIQKVASSTRLRGGQRVTYTLRVRNTGKQPAVNVDVCDKLPSQLAFTSTRGGTLKGSRLCFRTKTLAPGERAVYKVRVRVLPRSRKGPVVNRATAVADNAKSRSATARGQVTTDGKVSAEQVRGFTG